MHSSMFFLPLLHLATLCLYQIYTNKTEVNVELTLDPVVFSSEELFPFVIEACQVNFLVLSGPSFLILFKSCVSSLFLSLLMFGAPVIVIYEHILQLAIL